MRAALEAESEATPPPSAPPQPRPGLRERTRGSDEGVKLAPSPELEAVVRELRAEAVLHPTETPAPGKAPARPGRVAPAKLDVGNTVTEALRAHETMLGGRASESAVARPTQARLWLAIALFSVLLSVAAIWYTGTVSESPGPAPAAVPMTLPTGAVVSGKRQEPEPKVAGSRVSGLIAWAEPGETPVPQRRRQVYLTGLPGTATAGMSYIVPSDEEGYYEFRSVTPGPYKLSDALAAKPTWRLRIEVEAGKSSALDLGPGNSVQVRDDFPSD